jgi:hypothetical protein
MRRKLLGRSMLAMGLLCGAAALNACGPASGGAPPPPLAALPPTQTGPALAMALDANQLPPAPPPRLAHVASYGDGYAFVDRAYAMDVAFADSPPDYDFYDDGASPWVWVADDGSQCIAELSPIGWRYYYYEPGVSEPFYIEDPEYAYGFEGGALVVVYDHYGRQFGSGAMPGQDAIAGQFLARATSLRQAAAHDPHRAVTVADWTAHRDVLTSPRNAWARVSTDTPAWSAYRADHAQMTEAHWNDERLRREAWAARVDAGAGDPRRAAAEWRTAAAQAQRVANASGRPAPTWAGWRGRPPPVGSTGTHAQGAPSLAQAGPQPGDRVGLHGGAGHETLTDTRRGAGFAPRADEHVQGPRGGPTFQRAPQPGQAFAERHPETHAPRFAQAPTPREVGAPSAMTHGTPAAARVPEHAGGQPRTVPHPRFAEAPHHVAAPAQHAPAMHFAGPPPHAETPHFAGAPHHVAPPSQHGPAMHYAGPAHAAAAPHFAAPQHAGPPPQHVAPAAHAPAAAHAAQPAAPAYGNEHHPH